MFVLEIKYCVIFFKFILAASFAKALGFKKVSVYRVGSHGISEREDVIIGDDVEENVAIVTDVGETKKEQI